MDGGEGDWGDGEGEHAGAGAGAAQPADFSHLPSKKTLAAFVLSRMVVVPVINVALVWLIADGVIVADVADTALIKSV